MYLMSTLLLSVILSLVHLGVDLMPCAEMSDITVDTLNVNGIDYHLLRAAGFTGWGDGVRAPGEPQLPSSSVTVLLPPDSRVDHLEITGEEWVTLPGLYLLFPRQRGLTDDTLFIPPDSAVYSMQTSFPASPLVVSRQGSALGYSVVTLTGTPLRCIPADGTVQVLTSMEVAIHTAPSDEQRLCPERETAWSSEVRDRGIMALVCNPGDIQLYSRPATASLSQRNSPLVITDSPSMMGDGVDLVIITGAELEEAFRQVADHRTRQGIVTTVRTVEWIEQHYSGCDLPEMIRNFLRDAHVEWGVQAVLLGGDDGVVPVRQCNGWVYYTYPYPTYQMPSDDYFADIDGDWTAQGGIWSTGYQTGYLDLCVGRWPVDDPGDVETMFRKLLLYEQPEDFPEGYGRSLLLMGSNDVCGSAADDMMELRALLDSSSAVPTFLDEPTELYFPHSLPAGDLCRINALLEFDRGYNLILHADHSETHKLATAGKNTLGQYMWDSDFATMENDGRPSILWTLGCGSGHFDGADCFVEAGLTTHTGTGLVAAIANARYGLFNQSQTYFVFCDALFNTGYCRRHHGIHPQDWPLSYLGEAHRISKNTDGISYILLNLLGSPLMQVWRDDPTRLQLTVPSMVLVEGVATDIRVSVTDGVQPVAGATVCLWKDGEVFCIETTDTCGEAVFRDITVTDGSGDQDIFITALKHRAETGPDSSTVVSYLPAQKTLDVLPATVPVLSLDSFAVNDGGDGQANPGETVRLLLTVRNSGGETAGGVSAELQLVSGGQYIQSVPDSTSCFPDLRPDCSMAALDPVVVRIRQDVPSYSVAEFRVTFSCEGSSGTCHWDSPLFLAVSSEEYQLTVVDPSADNVSQDAALVTMENMVLVNSGLGEGRDLFLTVDNVYPEEPFKTDTVFIPGIGPGRALALEEDLALAVLPRDGNSSWMMDGFPRCSFDLVVLSQGGTSVARSVDVSLVSQLQDQGPEPPASAGVYETGQNSISLVWEHQGPGEAAGYYLYIDDGLRRRRVFPLPVPVCQATIEGLLPGSEYRVEVTTLDAIGRESQPSIISANTPRPALDGWPVQLAGSAGGGAAVADVDLDGLDELVLSTSFGWVYIMERDGSYQMLPPPPGYDYDRFLGCAVGDVDGEPGSEIVVSCQKYLEVEGQERVGILLYRRSGGSWSATEIAESQVNQQAASAMVAGTPVLFQADRGRSLEIALRTKGHFGALPQLYVWKMSSSGQWEDYGPEFPLDLLGYFYNSPTAVDFDHDGLEELLVTSIGTEGAGTAIIVADFQPEGSASITTRNLTELDTGGEVARVFGTLAAAEQDGCFYVAGVASTIDPSSTVKRLFVYTIEGPPAEMSMEWATGWVAGHDFYGNMPGPSLGDIDGDSDLDLVYLLNGGFQEKEGFLLGWDLASGQGTFISDTIPFNPIIEEGGHYIRSQPVVGPVSISGSCGMAVFSCFSTLLCGHLPSTCSSMISGFPAWSRDGGWATPAFCDLDGDGLAEVLHVDYSGLATLYGMEDLLYSCEGWHMYQDNPLRSGFYNTPPARGGLDIRVGPVCGGVIRESSELQRNFVLAEVCITGAVEDETGASDHGPGTVEIAALLIDGRRAGSCHVELTDGTHPARILLEERAGNSDGLRVVADPGNLYHEIDETNNESWVQVLQAEPDAMECSIPSPAGSMTILLDLSSSLPQGLSVLVYAVDGRLVQSTGTGELCAGPQLVRFLSDPLPSGVYTVLVSGLPSGEMIRKVVILNR